MARRALTMKRKGLIRNAMADQNTENETLVSLWAEAASSGSDGPPRGLPQVVETQSGSIGITVQGADDNLVIFQEGSRIETIYGNGFVKITTPPHSSTHLRFELWNPTGGPAKVRVELSPVRPGYVAVADGFTIPNLAFPAAQWGVRVVNRSGPAP